MQQQIQVERNEEGSGFEARRPPNTSGSGRGFQIINDAQEIIQEDITENYEQDFHSISNESHKAEDADNQIKEDFAQIEPDLAELPQEGKEQSSCKKGQSADAMESEGLAAECEKMRIQINRLKESILQRAQAEGEDTVQQLKRAVELNNDIIRGQEAEQVDFFTAKVGKDSFCIRLLPTSSDFEEKLIEEIEKLKVIINMSNLDVCRLKRETKRFEEILPLEEENKEEFYQRYKKLKRELDDKKEKYETQEQRERQLQVKLQKLRQKYEEIQSSIPHLPDYYRKYEEQQNLTSKQQDLNKRRDVEIKKNTLIMHQIQNNCQIIARTVLDLRKQNAELQQKINLLQGKNTLIEEDSSKLMQKFESQREKYKQKSIQKGTQRNDSYHLNSGQLKPILPLSSNRRKYYSQTKNSFITNIFDNTVPIDIEIGNTSNERYIPKILKNEKTLEGSNQNESIFKAGLGQSSTSNTLKQFKLKLPSHTPQKSSKNLNISLDIYKNTPTKPKSNQSKLSITQRLERIELLEKQDRIYSHKLYELKKQQQQKAVNLAVKAELSSNRALVNAISSAEQLPNHQKQSSRDARAISSSLGISKTEASMSQTSKIAPNSLYIHPSPTEAPIQENYSVTQRESQVQPQQSVSTSRLTDRLSHKFFKKRIIYRQKKISEDYMKILQQKGRKILELDNESEA